MKFNWKEASIILLATAVLPMGALAGDSISGSELEGLTLLPLFFLAHCAVCLPAISAYKKAPVLSLILGTLLYPLAVTAVLALLISPLSNPIGSWLWLAFISYAMWWVTLPVSGSCSFILYLFTRSKLHTPPPVPST